jgi:hypothetical protein
MRSTAVPVVVLLALLALLTACKKEPPAVAEPAKGTLPAAAAGSADKLPAGKLPAGHPPLGQGAAAAPRAAAGSGISGKVVETMDSGGYTYLKLETAQGEKWAAVQRAAVTRGQRVTVARAMLMRKFQSKSLDRTFDQIYFGTLAAGSAGSTGSPGGTGGAGGAAADPVTADPRRTVADVHQKAAGALTRVALDQPLPRAPGPEGRTVAEIYGQKTALKDKTVAVRGQVVKVNNGIMGRNWIHLQDGTRSGQNVDLTVTSQQTAAVGQTVLVRGTLRTDKNFGSGYLYSVIVEEASIAKQ